MTVRELASEVWGLDSWDPMVPTHGIWMLCLLRIGPETQVLAPALQIYRAKELGCSHALHVLWPPQPQRGLLGGMGYLSPECKALDLPPSTAPPSPFLSVDRQRQTGQRKDSWTGNRLIERHTDR